jgi:hypothetical protein
MDYLALHVHVEFQFDMNRLECPVRCVLRRYARQYESGIKEFAGKNFFFHSHLLIILCAQVFMNVFSLIFSAGDEI